MQHSFRGVIRVNAPPSLMQAFIVQVLTRFGLNQPALEIDLVGEFRLVSLERRETDIAIRYGRPEDGDVIAKKLCSVKYSFYGNSDWVEKIENGHAPEFITFNELNAHLPEATWLANAFPKSRIAMRALNQVSHAEAASIGIGIALLPDIVACKFPKLHKVDLNKHVPDREAWILKRRVDRNNETINAVWNELVTAFESAPDFFNT